MTLAKEIWLPILAMKAETDPEWRDKLDTLLLEFEAPRGAGDSERS